MERYVWKRLRERLGSQRWARDARAAHLAEARRVQELLRAWACPFVLTAADLDPVVQVPGEAPVRSGMVFEAWDGNAEEWAQRHTAAERALCGPGLGESVLGALTCVQRHGKQHADVKLDNVLFRETEGPCPEWALSDFDLLQDVPAGRRGVDLPMFVEAYAAFDPTVAPDEKKMALAAAKEGDKPLLLPLGSWKGVGGRFWPGARVAPPPLFAPAAPGGRVFPPPSETTAPFELFAWHDPQDLAHAAQGYYDAAAPAKLHRLWAEPGLWWDASYAGPWDPDPWREQALEDFAVSSDQRTWRESPRP